jgi:hypothetical protein
MLSTGLKTEIKSLIFVIMIAIVCSSTACFSAEFELWTAAGLRWDPNDDWRFTFQEAFRFDEEGRELYYKHTDVGVTYQGLEDWLDVSLRYRGVFGAAHDNKGHIENRPYLQINIKGDLLGFHVSNRNRLEYRDRKREDSAWRYRAMFTLNEPFERLRPRQHRRLKDKIRPYVSEELFFDLNDGRFDKNRLYGGLSCQLNERVIWNVFYLWQSSKSEGRWEGDLNVLGTTLTFLF